MCDLQRNDNRIGAECITICAKQLNSLAHAFFGQWVSFLHEFNEQLAFLKWCHFVENSHELVQCNPITHA